MPDYSDGTYRDGRYFENHFPWLHSTEVKLTYGEPIILSELSKEDQKHIGAYCQNVIHEMLQEHKNTKE